MAVNKVRRNGSYAPLSAHYYKDDAIAEAGEAAELLYVRGLAFCADVLSDGFISDTQLIRFVGVGMRDAKKRAECLVQVGLWAKEAGGYRVEAWLRWNRSKDDITAMQRKDADRKSQPPPDEPPSDLDSEPPPETDSERIPNGVHADSSNEGRPESVRNPASRAGSTPRNSTPKPTPRQGSGSRSSPAHAPVTAQSVVKVWVDAARANNCEPSESQIKQVGKTAKEILAKNTPELVMAAATSAGTKGFPSIDRELTVLAAQRSAAANGSQPSFWHTDPNTGRTFER